MDVTRSSRDGQDSYRNTSDRSCEPSDTGGHVEIAGDHATQRVAAMGREVMSATREGGEGGAVHGVLEQMRPLAWSPTYRASCAAARRKWITLMLVRGEILNSWCICVVKERLDVSKNKGESGMGRWW